jgi:hypothetical protein
MLTKLFHPSITLKLILFLGAISLLPLVLGIVSYNTSRSVIQEDVRQFTLALMVEQKNYLDLTLQEVESLITNISSVEDIIEEHEDVQTYI